MTIPSETARHYEFAQESLMPLTERKLKSFSEFPHGWHYGQGIPPSDRNLKLAHSLYLTALTRGFVESDAFPGAEGEVRVTFYRGDYYYEFTVEADGSIRFVLEHGNSEVESLEGLEFDEAKKKLVNMDESLWTSSDLSTTANTIDAGGDFKVYVSDLRPMGPESLSSARTVFIVQGTASVSTFRNITPQPWTTRRYSGSSPRRDYQLVAA